MSRPKPRPHVFSEGGGIVTGTHDVKVARRLIVELYLEEVEMVNLPLDPDDYDGRVRVAEASHLFSVGAAAQEVGRIVPTGADPYEYAWFWRSGYALGKPGVTRAVVWRS